MSDMDANRTDTLNVLQGWDALDSLRASNEQAIERWRLKSEVVTPPVPTRKPRRFSARRLTKNLEHTVDTESNSTGEQLIKLRVTDIEEFAFNPRKFAGENFADLKESIRTSGIESTISVTKIPDRAAYTIAAGGNSRLRAIQELFSESNDPRFEYITCRLVPFTDLRTLKFAHLRENNHRSNMCFWDKANAALDLLDDFEKKEGRKAKNEEAVEYLLQGDRSVSVTMLNLYRFAVDNLSALGASVQVLVMKDVQNVFRPQINATIKLAQLFEVDPLKVRREAVNPVLELLSLRYEELGTFDIQFFPGALRESFSRLVGMSSQDLAKAEELQQRMPGLTLEALRPLLLPSASVTGLVDSPTAGVSQQHVPATTRIPERLLPTGMVSHHRHTHRTGNDDATLCESPVSAPTSIAASPNFGQSPMNSTPLIQSARNLVNAYFEGAVSIIESPALPYGFMVELPDTTGDDQVFLKNASLWWELLSITEQTSLQGMQVLPPSEFTDLCLQDENWATAWKIKLEQSPAKSQFATFCEDMLTAGSKGDALWQFMESARGFRRNHPERFCQDFWSQQGVIV